MISIIYNVKSVQRNVDGTFVLLPHPNNGATMIVGFFSEKFFPQSPSCLSI